MSPHRGWACLPPRGTGPLRGSQLDVRLFPFYPGARRPSVSPPRLQDQSVKQRRHPAVAASRLASGCRQTAEGPYTRQAMSPPPQPRLPSSPASRALLTARGCAACAADRTGTGARRGARRSLRSVLPPAPSVLPQSRRGVEGAERPAPSQAPAGGAPGHSTRGSGRPLLEPPRDRPEVRARTLKRPAGSLHPFLALSLTCCAIWVKSMSSMTTQPGPTAQKIVFLCPSSLT